MEYKAKLFGKICSLPTRTLEVDEQIEGMKNLDGRYQSGEISRREAVEQMHAFVEALAPGVAPPVEEVDVNELTNACTEICSVYAAPVRRFSMASQLEELREALNRPEVQKILAAAQTMQNHPSHKRR